MEVSQTHNIRLALWVVAPSPVSTSVEVLPHASGVAGYLVVSSWGGRSIPTGESLSAGPTPETVPSIPSQAGRLASRLLEYLVLRGITIRPRTRAHGRSCAQRGSAAVSLGVQHLDLDTVGDDDIATIQEPPVDHRINPIAIQSIVLGEVQNIVQHSIRSQSHGGGLGQGPTSHHADITSPLAFIVADLEQILGKIRKLITVGPEGRQDSAG